VSETESRVEWWSKVSIRICHATLEPAEISDLLYATPELAQRPGESKIPHGNCRSAGYWCLSHLIESPQRPDAAILWAEKFVRSRESQIRQLLELRFDVDVYIGVFSSVLALGFELPPTPTIWSTGIPLGIEFFAQ
jgi:hypothetical protein